MRFYVSRIAGRDRDHRDLGRAVAAGNSSCPRSRAATQCANNIKQLGLAAENFISAKKVFPVGLQGPSVFQLATRLRRADVDERLCRAHAVYRAGQPSDSLRQEKPRLATLLVTIPGTAGDSTSIAAQIVVNFRCPSSLLVPQNTVSPGYIFGTNDYAGNGGTRVYEPVADHSQAIGRRQTSRRSKSQHESSRHNITTDCLTSWNAATPERASNKSPMDSAKHSCSARETATIPDNAVGQAFRLHPRWMVRLGMDLESKLRRRQFGAFGGRDQFSDAAGLESNTHDAWDRICAWGSSHSGGANFCYADGSVSFLPDSTDLTVLQALATIRGEEITIIRSRDATPDHVDTGAAQRFDLR